MQVAQLWRFPVKSLQGERVDSAPVGVAGVAGDRRFAIFDLASGLGLTARRVPELLFASARLCGDGGVRITLPDGRPADDDRALSAWLGRPVALRSTAEVHTRRYENPADFEHEGAGVWRRFEGSGDAFHDTAAAAVSLVSTATIGDWAVRRFRANIILAGEGEDDLVGGRVGLGDAVLDVGLAMKRCVMVTRPQPGSVERDLDVLRRINRDRSGCLAVGATVVREGTVSVGDALNR